MAKTYLSTLRNAVAILLRQTQWRGAARPEGGGSRSWRCGIARTCECTLHSMRAGVAASSRRSSSRQVAQPGARPRNLAGIIPARSTSPRRSRAHGESRAVPRSMENVLSVQRARARQLVDRELEREFAAYGPAALPAPRASRHRLASASVARWSMDRSQSRRPRCSRMLRCSSSLSTPRTTSTAGEGAAARVAVSLTRRRRVVDRDRRSSGRLEARAVAVGASRSALWPARRPWTRREAPSALPYPTLSGRGVWSVCVCCLCARDPWCCSGVRPPLHPRSCVCSVGLPEPLSPRRGRVGVEM